MKLTYWYARCTTDSDLHSVRSRTLKAAKVAVAEGSEFDEFEPIEKVTIEYSDAFNLLAKSAAEGRRNWWRFG